MDALHLVGIVLGGAGIGWLLGGLVNWAADHLPAYPARPVPWHSGLPRRLVVPTSIAHTTTGAPRQLRAWALQTGTALAVSVTFWRLAGQPWWVVALVTLYVALMAAILVIDLEHRRVLNIMLAPAAVVALLGSLLPGMPGIREALLGGAAGFAFFLAVFLIGRGRMGAGDVKLAGVIGLMTGWSGVIPALAGGIVLGGLAALYLLVVRRAGRRATMAYAPYLALGAMGTFWWLWGRPFF